MSRSSFFAALFAVLVLSTGMAFAQSAFYVTNVTGTFGSAPHDTLQTGVPVQWTLALRNQSGGVILALNNGFNINDNGTGSEWPIPVLDTLNIQPTSGSGWRTRYDGLVAKFHDADNNGGVGARDADTIAIGAFNIFASGFENGFDFNVITITLPAPGISNSHHGKTLCLDSARYDVALNDWLWSTSIGGEIPAWAGPHCYKIYDPNAPVLTNLVVTPDSLSFIATEGGSNPVAQQININSDGASLAFLLNEDAGWFSTSIPGGNTPAMANVNVSIAGLTPGNYRDTVYVTSTGANNSPTLVVVKLSIAGVTKFLDVNPDTLYFTAQENGATPEEQSFTVGETGGFAIAYTVTENSTRIGLNTVGGNTPSDVGVDVNIAGLIPGVYIDSVIVASGAAINSPVKEYIRIQITPAPKFLDVSPDTLHFSAVLGGANPAAKKFAVTETGGNVIAYSLLENAGWILLDKSGGNTPDSVTVSIDLFGLNPASYLDSVQVSSGSADNSPVFEYISLEVSAPVFMLDVTPDSLTFTAQEGSANPPNQNFGVIETGGGNISYTLSEGTPWFSLNKGGGNTPDVVTVMVDISGLAPNTYYGNISVTSGEASNSPITEVIKLVVTAVPKVLMASPNSWDFVVVDGGPVFPSALVNVTDSFNVGLAYTVGDDVDWANVTPNSGTTPDAFMIVADTAGVDALTPGFYQDTILITSGTASNSPVRVFITLEILTEPNEPPVIANVNDVELFEGESASLIVSASDADEDAIHLFNGPLPSFVTFDDFGNGTGEYTLNPNFSDAGVYPITLYASDNKDTVSESFTVTVLDKEPGTEGDTLHVGTVPAVPGQQVVVPVEIANSCDLYAVYVPFTWDSDDVIFLDSIKFNESLLAGIANKFVSIDNDGWTGEFGFTADEAEFPIAPGHYHLADMYFSVSPVTPQGAYAITPGLATTTFTRNCSDFGEMINPVIPGGGGNIVVDTTNVYVCGYVVNEEGVGIWGAQVELWSDYPCEGPIQTTLTNGDGAYAFTDFSLGGFDLYAWKRGDDSTTWNDAYYPNDVHVNFGENGIMIQLDWLNHLEPSDVWVDYFCNENTLFNCALPVGSVVEVWDEDDILCGRQFVREAGTYRFMPVYRDSALSIDDEGATTGDNLRFYINGVQALTFGNTIFPDEYGQVEVCLSGGARLSKECLLTNGNWNLVSWNLDTDTDEIEDVLSSLEGCVEVVLGFEAGGLTYVPGMDIFNTLEAVDHLSGYWMKLGEDCNNTLEISGVPVEQDTPIAVRRGWNLVSYLPEDAHDVEDALYSLENNLLIAYTFDIMPLVYVPPMDPIFNNLEQMEPCFGYWLKLENAGVLTYPAANGAMPKINWPIAQGALGSEDKLVEPTRNWVNMYSHNLTVDGQSVPVGAQVTAHNLAGKVVGHYEMKENGTFGFMPVYADDANESTVGIKKGENFYLSVDGNKTDELFSWTEHGGLIEVMALTSGAGPGNTLPDAYALDQNYPNPFNPSTTINFSLPVASKARLEIFNLLGQVVATPFDGEAQAGEHEVVWDGKSSTGEVVASGIYLYRLTADKFVQTRKMTLLK